MVQPSDQRPAKRPKGITCPACAMKLKTKRVIPLADGSVRRVRWCRWCGHRCSTYERVGPVAHPATDDTPYCR